MFGSGPTTWSNARAVVPDSSTPNHTTTPNDSSGRCDVLRTTAGGPPDRRPAFERACDQPIVPWNGDQVARTSAASAGSSVANWRPASEARPADASAKASAYLAGFQVGRGTVTPTHFAGSQPGVGDEDSMATRFAVLGTGHWATTTHAAAVAAHPEAELVAVWGRDLAKARAAAAPYGAAAYDDLDTTLSHVDAVAVAVPPDVQARLAIRAATAGKHLLLDKPLALTVAAADDVVLAAAVGGVASVVFFTSRYLPEVDAFLPEAVAAGFDSARVAMLGNILGDDNPYRDSVWRHEYGGLWDLGPHALALLLPVLGPIVEVTAVPALHGVTHVVATHEPGSVSTMALSVLSPNVRHEFVFTGPDGEVPAPVSPAQPTEPARSLGVAIDQLLEQVATGRRDHPCDVRFAREVTAVLAAAERARDTGQRTAV